MNVKDILARAGKTFVQVFLVAVPVTALFTDNPLPVVYAGALSAGAAALAIIWNAALQWSSS